MTHNMNLKELDEKIKTAFDKGRMSLFRASFECLGDDESIKTELGSSAQPLLFCGLPVICRIFTTMHAVAIIAKSGSCIIGVRISPKHGNRSFIEL